ncbi:MvdC/MvdD family ATP grasp protein [Chitinophaga lutea]
MHNGKVLIITHSADNEAVDAVGSAITALGGRFLRFDVDQYPVSAALTSRYDDDRWRLTLGSESLDDVTAVWYRRSYNIGKGLAEMLERDFLPSALGEVRRTLFGMLESLPCFQLERYSTYRRLDSKEEQLRLAASAGLAIPRTCITNSPAELRAFLQHVNGPVVAKMQSAFAILQENEELVVFTSDLRDDHLEQLPQLQYCPMMFQEKLPKALELRVTIVGRQVFSHAVDSQTVPAARTDWRKEGAALVNAWRSHPLPADIKAALLALMDAYGLNYGAIDLILTPEGQYYFLEVNAAGEFFWLDKLSRGAISRQLAAVLLGQTDRR